MINFTNTTFVEDTTVLSHFGDKYLVMKCNEESTILCELDVDFYNEIEVLNADFCEENSSWVLIE